MVYQPLGGDLQHCEPPTFSYLAVLSPSCSQMKFQKVTTGAFPVRPPSATLTLSRGMRCTFSQSVINTRFKKNQLGTFSRLQLIVVGCSWLWLAQAELFGKYCALPSMSQHCGNCLLCCNPAYQRYVPRRHHSLCLKATAVGSWDDLIRTWLQRPQRQELETACFLPWQCFETGKIR